MQLRVTESSVNSISTRLAAACSAVQPHFVCQHYERLARKFAFLHVKSN